MLHVDHLCVSSDKVCYTDGNRQGRNQNHNDTTRTRATLKTQKNRFALPTQATKVYIPNPASRFRSFFRPFKSPLTSVSVASNLFRNCICPKLFTSPRTSRQGLKSHGPTFQWAAQIKRGFEGPTRTRRNQRTTN